MRRRKGSEEKGGHMRRREGNCCWWWYEKERGREKIEVKGGYWGLTYYTPLANLEHS